MSSTRNATKSIDLADQLARRAASNEKDENLRQSRKHCQKIPRLSSREQIQKTSTLISCGQRHIKRRGTLTDGGAAEES